MTPQDPGAIINGLFQFVFVFAALLAFGQIVYAGFQYIVGAAGNPGAQSDAKSRITDAILGLILLGCAAVVLSSINPGFLNIRILGLGVLDAPIPPTPGVSGGACSPITGTSPASLDALKTSCFGPSEQNAAVASSIAAKESGGIPTVTSTLDICRDGASFSMGLFQINVIANQSLSPSACQGLFDVKGAGPQGACLERDARGICRVRDCKVKDGKQSQYLVCQQAMFNSATNIAIACQIWKRSGWNAWGANTMYCHF